MTGTKAGGKKAAKTNKALHGKDFYKVIGAKGGRNGHTGGFASSHELAVRAGRIGGSKSKRTGIKNGDGKRHKKVDTESEAENNMIGLLGRVFGGKKNAK